MSRKYLIVPGWMPSANDNDTHWISARELMRLFRLSPSDCIIVPQRQDRSQWEWNDRSLQAAQSIHWQARVLVPQYLAEDYDKIAKELLCDKP